jgi:hypothetical protein
LPTRDLPQRPIEDSDLNTWRPVLASRRADEVIPN